jgi:SAM-dependent methyltransferase
LGIKLGVEPAAEMGAIAESRGVRIQRALAEDLPFGDGQFDFALLVTVLCFVRDPVRALSEIRRVLKPGGLVLVGFVDRESRAGRRILSSGSKYYRDANLYSARDMLELLTRAGFRLKDSRQTLFENPQTLVRPEQPKPGFGDGDFIVFAAQKPA